MTEERPKPDLTYQETIRCRGCDLPIKVRGEIAYEHEHESINVVCQGCIDVIEDTHQHD